MTRILNFSIMTMLGVAGLLWALWATDAPPGRTMPLPAQASAVPMVVARGIVDVDGGLIQLAASREGIVQEVHVEEGTAVKKGTVLLVVDNRAARVQFDVVKAQYQEARSALVTTKLRIRTAEREMNRLEPIVQRQAASVKSLDAQARDRIEQARAELAQQDAAVATAEARLASAALEVEQRTVRAPVDGTIVRRLVRPGDGISTMTVTPLFWLAPAAPTIVRAEIEELTAAHIAKNQMAEILVEGDDTQRFTGRVERVGRAFGPRRVTVYDSRQRADVRVVECIITFDKSIPDLLLGQRVIVRIKSPPMS